MFFLQIETPKRGRGRPRKADRSQTDSPVLDKAKDAALGLDLLHQHTVSLSMSPPTKADGECSFNMTLIISNLRTIILYIYSFNNFTLAQLPAIVPGKVFETIMQHCSK